MFPQFYLTAKPLLFPLNYVELMEGKTLFSGMVEGNP